MSYYGYNFKERNSGGLGAIIHDLMMACKYAEENNLQIGFIQEGYEIPRLNGSIDDIPDIPDKNWHSYFSSFPIVDEIQCLEIWPNFLPDSNITKWNKEQFHNLLANKICVFKPEIHDEITSLVNNTPFNASTDIVIHIRQTDKISEANKFLSIEIFIKECEYALDVLSKESDTLNRIYICTDNQLVCESIQNHFKLKNIDVVWDNSELIFLYKNYDG